MGFVGLYTGLSAIRAAQTGIDVASNNVANSATPGHTRQRVELVAGPRYDSPVGPQGTGVTVAQIGRLRDSFLDTRVRTAIGDHAETSVRANLLGTLEALTGEPDSGISTRLTALWTAAEAWANDPAEPATRRQVMNELTAVGETFRSVVTQWDTLEADVRHDRDVRLTQINDALAQLAELDARIVNVPDQRVGPALHDQRDLLLDDIAQLTGGTARVGTDGRSEVLVAGVNLVPAEGPATLGLVDGVVTITRHDGTTASAAGQLGGMVGGLTRVLEQDIPAFRQQMNAVAAGIADAINEVNRAGVTADGTPGGDLLSYDPADPARTLVRATEDLRALAAARDVTSPQPHDGSNARRLANLRIDAVTIPNAEYGGEPSAAASLSSHFADVVTGLASSVAAAKGSASASRSIAVAAATARDSEHGVSIDEEMVELVRYQRALEAAARVMTTIDQALDVLVNRVGIVGR